jgi:superfamily II DNA or RNA helicase
MEIPKDYIPTCIKIAKILQQTKLDKHKIFEYLTCLKYEAVPYHRDFIDRVLIDKCHLELFGMAQNIKDTGIDCLTYDGLTAIQCKFYKQDGHVNHSEVSKFLACSFNPRYQFPNRILVLNDNSVTVSKVNENEYIKQIIIKSEQTELMQCIQKIYKTHQKQILNAKDKKKAKPTLRNYQKAAIKNIQSQDSPRIKMPCGSGKSVVIIEYIKRYCKDKRVLILVPTIVLCDQFYRLCKEENFNVAKLCTNESEDTIAEIDSYNVFVCVYNSVELVLHVKFYHVFVDEAHHIDIPQIYTSKNQAIPPFKKNVYRVKCKKRVMLSATIDNPTYEYTLDNAIRDGVLNDYNISALIFDDEPNEAAVARVVFEKLTNGEIDNLLAYSLTIKKAQSFCKEMNKLQRGICAFICADTSLTSRQKIIESFKTGELKVISSINTLSEGLDLTNAHGSIFLDPRKSRISVIQIIGRVMRKMIDKRLGKIFIPCTEEDCEKKVGKLLRLLSNEDEFVKKCMIQKRVQNILSVEKIQDDEEMVDANFLEEKIYDRLSYFSGNLDKQLDGLIDFIITKKRLPTKSDPFGIFLSSIAQSVKGQHQGYTKEFLEKCQNNILNNPHISSECKDYFTVRTSKHVKTEPTLNVELINFFIENNAMPHRNSNLGRNFDIFCQAFKGNRNCWKQYLNKWRDEVLNNPNISDEIKQEYRIRIGELQRGEPNLNKNLVQFLVENDRFPPQSHPSSEFLRRFCRSITNERDHWPAYLDKWRDEVLNHPDISEKIKQTYRTRVGLVEKTTLDIYSEFIDFVIEHQRLPPQKSFPRLGGFVNKLTDGLKNNSDRYKKYREKWYADFINHPDIDNEPKREFRRRIGR